MSALHPDASTLNSVSHFKTAGPGTSAPTITSLDRESPVPVSVQVIVTGSKFPPIAGGTGGNSNAALKLQGQTGSGSGGGPPEDGPQEISGILSSVAPSMAASTAARLARASAILAGSAEKAAISGATRSIHSRARGNWTAMAESTAHSLAAATQLLHSLRLSMVPSPPKLAQ